MTKENEETSDFCILETPVENRLSKFERLSLVGGMELQRAIGRLADQLKDFNIGLALDQIDLKLHEQAKEFYGNKSWSSSPDDFFPLPPAPLNVNRTLVHGLKDGEICDLSFPSEYQVTYKDFAAEFNGHTENSNVYARHWKHSDKATAELIVIHGSSMGDQRLNSLVFLPGVFYSLGFNVVMFELPFHGRRKPKNIKSEHILPSANPFITNEAIGQTIWDLRKLYQYLGSTGASQIGVMGMSLGAYVAALWGSLPSAHDRLDFLVALVPLASMAEAAWERISRAGSAVTSQISREILEKVYFVHCPLNHSPRLLRERVLIVAGLGDEVVSPRQAKLLADHWKQPRTLWYQGGHTAQLKREDCFTSVIKFLDEIFS